jgi:MFS superfamily sulfate permease-like transporter
MSHKRKQKQKMMDLTALHGSPKERFPVSPMVTHFPSPLTPPNSMEFRSSSDGCVHRNRSRSLGDQCDDFPHLDRLLLPIQSQNSIAALTLKSEPPKNEEERKEDLESPIWLSCMYGVINAAIVLPVLMSFGSIIYRDDFFGPYMPVLIRLTVISGMIHQVCFSTLSSLPFAVGQVQDAGLIFLSGMAGNLVQDCKSQGHNDEAILATVTIALSIATGLLGLGLVFMGKLQLAQYVQMLPVSVIAGYLAFIGWFCGISGLALMSSGGGADIKPVVMFQNAAFILPGILGGLVIYLLVRKLRHMAVLPTCIIFLILGFYVVLFATGTSVEDATKNGWIRSSEPPAVWYHTWDYLQFNKVVWNALPRQTLTLFGMIFVVALSSSLDVAAIELELNEPLNYNSELTMVGISNVVSGLTGGYTGSYIFSQSIFSLRAGIRSRVAGFMLAFCEFIFLILPIPILSYVPNFFFGSLLIMICIDLMYEWLWDVRKKITYAEYAVCLATFGLIQLLGVEYGIITGVLLYVACQKVGLDVGVRKGAPVDVSVTERVVLVKSQDDNMNVANYGSV